MPTELPSCDRFLRCRNAWRARALLSGLLVLLLLGGCHSLQPGLPPPDSDATAVAKQAASAARAAAQQGQALLEPRYLRFKADETQLSDARDDGRYTYLEFASPAGAELELFDQDGRPLESATSGRIVAVRGVPAGILVRRAERASFVSQNPRTVGMPRLPFPDTAAHAEARARLEGEAGQLQAMQRALEAARLAVASTRSRDAAGRGGTTGGAAEPAPGHRSVPPPPGLAPPATSPAPPQDPQSVPLSPIRQGTSLLPEVVYAAPPSAMTRLQPPAWRDEPRAAGRGLGPPLAAANASASVPERGLVRVFFATASRAIVAPEDGLGLLLREAVNADAIRVTGFTDATGSRATNDALALARADAIVQILLRRGIPPNRIFSSAVGADEYIADNASERGRALNRRVEVLLLRDGAPMALGGPARAIR